MEPTFKALPAFTVVGMTRTYTMESNHEIPKLWDAFILRMEEIPGAMDGHCFGLCETNETFDPTGKGGDAEFQYTAAMEVSAFHGDVPSGMRRIVVPGQSGPSSGTWGPSTRWDGPTSTPTEHGCPPRPGRSWGAWTSNTTVPSSTTRTRRAPTRWWRSIFPCGAGPEGERGRVQLPSSVLVVHDGGSMTRVLVFLVATFFVLMPLRGQSLVGFDDLVQVDGAPAVVETCPDAAANGGFLFGFNQAWMKNHYGSQWTSAWDEAEVRRILALCRDAGGKVLRMWLFEGLGNEGVIWNGADRTRPTGLSAEKLENVETFLRLAGEHGIRVYLTFFDGNIHDFDVGANGKKRRDEFHNILNEKYGAGAAYREKVLGPLLEVVARHREAVFAIDLMNEINSLVTCHDWKIFEKGRWFRHGWSSARSFVKTWRAFIRARVDVPVTASFGYPRAVRTLKAKVLPPEMVDFYDIHLYDSDGEVPSLRAFIRETGRKVYLGEFGQGHFAKKSEETQCRSLKAFVRNARAAGLSGAFPWRLSEPNGDAPYSFTEKDVVWRPALVDFRDMATR